jgi:nucleotide-binding universal stress UspA family protein
VIKRILCPLDFSEPSQHAVEHAVALGRWYKAAVSALYVYSPPFVPIPGLPHPTHRVSDEEVARVRTEALKCFAAAGEREVTVLVDVGEPAPQIVDCARRLSADLVVMGTHGAGGFEHLMLGSVAEKVLRKSSVPVMTVPPRAYATSRLPFKTLLCAIDFSDSSLAGLTLAASLARESDAAITLLHVIEWPWQEPPAPSWNELPPAQAAALTEYRRYLEQGAVHRLDALAADGAARCTSRVAHGKAYEVILRTAQELRADLIVMGVHGRSAADLAMFGSTTNQIVRRASCPVLTLRR